MKCKGKKGHRSARKVVTIPGDPNEFADTLNTYFINAPVDFIGKLN